MTISTALDPEVRRPAMIRRITEPEKIRDGDPAVTWRVTLDEPPPREWRHRFLDHAYSPGFFFHSRIRVDGATIVFELERTALWIGLERIDEWIGETNAAYGYPVEEPGRQSSTDTILVVDDERGIRELASEILEQAGFTLIDTGDPREALRIVRARPIQLLLTDVVMPAMNGLELAERVESFSPETKVLFMSAYSSSVLRVGVPFIAKPFSLSGLVRAVRDVCLAEPRTLHRPSHAH